MTTRPLLALLFLAACGGTTHTAPPEVHRAFAATCSPSAPAITCDATSEGDGNCLTNADCTSGTNGLCGDAFGPFCVCSYDECHTDADCQTGQACTCAGTITGSGRSVPTRDACVTSGCRTDGDCGVGQYCGASWGFDCGPSGGAVVYACTTKDDECRTDADCAHLDGGGATPYCAYDSTRARWACNAGECEA